MPGLLPQMLSPDTACEYFYIQHHYTRRVVKVPDASKARSYMLKNPQDHGQPPQQSQLIEAG